MIAAVFPFCMIFVIFVMQRESDHVFITDIFSDAASARFSFHAPVL